MTSVKFPGQEAYLARTVVPLATTLYKIGIVKSEKKNYISGMSKF